MNNNNFKKLFANHKFDIVGHDFMTIRPTASTVQNLNQKGNEIKFSFTANDEFVSPKILLKISGAYSSNDATKPYDGTTSTVKMVNNYTAHLFDRVEVYFNNTFVDQIEETGVASTVKCCVSHDGPTANGLLEIKSFKSIAIHGGYFSALCELSDLGLGFFGDIDVPIYNGSFDIVFRRNDNDNVLCKYGTTVPNDGKVEINDMHLRVPIVTYEANVKPIIISELTKEPYVFIFKQWQNIKLYNVSGKTFSHDFTGQYRNTENPIAAFVVFQKDKEKDQAIDNNTFDHMYVKNLHVELGGKRYPKESWNLDWEKSDYCLAYEAHTFYKKKYMNDNINYLEAYAFKDSFPIYSLDLSNQPITIDNTKTSMILNVDFDKTVTAATGTKGTTCFVILVSRKAIKYNVVNKVVEECVL